MNPLPLNILFEDPNLLVIHKPKGLLSQGARPDEPNLVDFLRVYLKRPYVGLVHRLDRNTTGLMVIAKRSKSAERLTLALQKGELKRHYLAWCEGVIQTQTNVWTHWILKNPKNNKSTLFKNPLSQSHPAYKKTKLAKLSVFILKTSPIQGTNCSLCRFELETGRSHQIRAQSAFEGHPIVGDLKYGASPQLGFKEPLLHSCFLEFPHPITKKILKFELPPPQGWP